MAAISVIGVVESLAPAHMLWIYENEQVKGHY